MLTHFKKNSFSFNFQIFKLFTVPLQNKGQSKKKRERNDKNNCLICFLREQFPDSKAKTRGIALNIRRFFENSYTVDTH